MFCIKCGAPLKDSARFCPKCGEPVLSGYNSFEKKPDAGRRQIYTYENQAPMKWFKFVIWVQLFLAALSAVAAAVNYFTGTYWGEYASYYYSHYYWLRLLDIITGILYFLLAAAAIYVRFQLSGLKKMAPRLYIYFIIVTMFIRLIYIILVGLILRMFVMSSTVIIEEVVNGIMIVLNIIYFRKREHLFVN